MSLILRTVKRSFKLYHNGMISRKDKKPKLPTSLKNSSADDMCSVEC